MFTGIRGAVDENSDEGYQQATHDESDVIHFTPCRAMVIEVDDQRRFERMGNVISR